MQNINVLYVGFPILAHQTMTKRSFVLDSIMQNINVLNVSFPILAYQTMTNIHLYLTVSIGLMQNINVPNVGFPILAHQTMTHKKTLICTYPCIATSMFCPVT